MHHPIVRRPRRGSQVPVLRAVVVHSPPVVATAAPLTVVIGCQLCRFFRRSWAGSGTVAIRGGGGGPGPMARRGRPGSRNPASQIWSVPAEFLLASENSPKLRW